MNEENILSDLPENIRTALKEESIRTGVPLMTMLKDIVIAAADKFQDSETDQSQASQQEAA
jgi:cation transport regulator ChaB